MTDVPQTLPLRRALDKAAWRLLPFLLLLYILAFLDRANVGFAKQALQTDTGLSDSAYAFGAGLFFAGYALLEIPSNLILHRVGARFWLSRIMVTWGLVAAAMFLAWTPLLFWLLRFLLGVAEAGFFPGVLLYLTFWFPARERGRILGYFYFGAPLALIFGGPLSGALMELDSVWGLRGWQWMFLVEGLAASVVGVWTYWYLPNRPHDAPWLTNQEKRALSEALWMEEQRIRETQPINLWSALKQRRLLHLAVIYLLIQVSVYGVTFYLPSQVEKLVGQSAGWEVGMITAIPWCFALVGLWAVPRLARRWRERRHLAAAVLSLAGLGIASSASPSPVIALAALSLAAAGFISVQPVFWTFPSERWTGSAAAAALAFINSCGALGGFLAPNIRSWADRALSWSGAGVHVLAVTTVAGALLLLLLPGATAKVEAAVARPAPKPS